VVLDAVNVHLFVRPYCSTTKMQPIVTDGVAWSVCLSVTIVWTTKMAEPVKMSFRWGLGWAKGTMY